MMKTVGNPSTKSSETYFSGLASENTTLYITPGTGL